MINQPKFLNSFLIYIAIFGFNYFYLITEGDSQVDVVGRALDDQAISGIGESARATSTCTVLSKTVTTPISAVITKSTCNRENMGWDEGYVRG